MKNKTFINIIILCVFIFTINYLTKNSILDFFKKYYDNIKNHIQKVLHPVQKKEIVKKEKNFRFTYQEPKENLIIKKVLSNLNNNIKLPEELIIPKSVNKIDEKHILKFLKETLIDFKNIEIISQIKYCKFSNNNSELKPFNIKTYYQSDNFEGTCILNISLYHSLSTNKEIFIDSGIIQFQGSYGRYKINNINLVNFIKNNKKLIKPEKEEFNIDSIDINTEFLHNTENLEIDSINSLIPDEILLTSEYEGDSTEETTINDNINNALV